MRSYNELLICINGLKKANLKYLVLLSHQDMDQKTPLDLAFDNKNKKIINLIISSLVELDPNQESINLSLFKQHFTEMLNYESFFNLL